MGFVNEPQICHWCKEPMPYPLPDGIIYDGGWIHPECRLAKQVAGRLKPMRDVHMKSEIGMEVRKPSKLFKWKLEIFK